MQEAMGAEMRRTIATLNDFVDKVKQKDLVERQLQSKGTGDGSQGRSPVATMPHGSLGTQTRASSPRTGSAALQRSHIELQHFRADIMDSAKAIQDEIEQMTQGSVSYRTVEVGGLPSARTADGSMNARVSIQVRTREQGRDPKVQITRESSRHQKSIPVNPNVSTALPRLKLTEEGQHRRHYLSSSTKGLRPVDEGSARRRDNIDIEVPPYAPL